MYDNQKIISLISYVDHTISPLIFNNGLESFHHFGGDPKGEGPFDVSGVNMPSLEGRGLDSPRTSVQ